MNTYTYVLNSPIRFIDVFGLDVTCQCEANDKKAMNYIDDGSKPEGATMGRKYCYYNCVCQCSNGRNLDNVEVYAPGTKPYGIYAWNNDQRCLSLTEVRDPRFPNYNVMTTDTKPFTVTSQDKYRWEKFVDELEKKCENCQ